MNNELYLASTYLKVLTRSNHELAANLQQLLGPHADELLNSDYIYGEDINRVFSAFAANGLDSWLLKYGQQLDVASHGPLGFAVLSAPDLETAMDVLAKYLVIRSSAYRCEFVQGDTRAEFIVHDLTTEPVIGRWLVETGIRVVQQLIESVMAHPLGDHAVIHFASPAPNYKAELESFYGVPCKFDQAEHKISIPASWGRISSPLYDQATFNSNLRKCQELKLSLAGSEEVQELVALRFTQYFANQVNRVDMDTALPSMESLAQEMHMSTRTLSRKLKDENTSYKALLELARQTQALFLLKNTHLTVANVAYNLNYQEPANFVRAFKSWFSTTPAAWRRTSS